MSQPINITNKDILHQLKLSCKIPEIIEQIITRKVIQHAASEVGIKIEIEELQKLADEMRLMNNLLNVEETWAWLEKHSLSLDDFEEILYNNLLSTKLAIHLLADKIQPYFHEHQLDYIGAVIYEVLLDDEDFVSELFYAIKQEEMSFYDVAHQYIQDLELRRKGGYQGIVHRRDLKPEISAAVFAAKPPQLLQPIVTAKGVHLVFVEEIIQPQLDNQLAYQIGKDLFEKWLKKEIEQFNFQLVID
ncbi:MAG: peptidylprolyl isomerase [Nostoc sp. CreGUA01]|nr:peptidylprolyl isomerase [Nostoc sp. CreGUA01]